MLNNEFEIGSKVVMYEKVLTYAPLIHERFSGLPPLEIFTRLLLIWFCNWPGAIEGHRQTHTTTTLTRLTCRPRSYRWTAAEEKNRCRSEFAHRATVSEKSRLELDTAALRVFFSTQKGQALGSAFFCRFFPSERERIEVWSAQNGQTIKFNE